MNGPNYKYLITSLKKTKRQHSKNLKDTIEGCPWMFLQHDFVEGN